MPHIEYPPMTWEQFADRAAARMAPDCKTSGGNASLAYENGTPHWDGGKPLPDAIEMMRTGWSEGVKALKAKLAEVSTDTEDRAVWALRECGVFPCVPAYIAGDPDCMWLQDETEATKRRAITLVLSGGNNWRIHADAAMAYATAAAAIVRRLEAEGVDVEVVLNYGAGSGNTSYQTLVYVRRFGEPVDLERIAAAFHPAVQRRINFAHMELIPELDPLTITSYGVSKPSSRAAAARLLGADPDSLVTIPSVGDLFPKDARRPLDADRVLRLMTQRMNSTLAGQ